MSSFPFGYLIFLAKLIQFISSTRLLNEMYELIVSNPPILIAIHSGDEVIHHVVLGGNAGGEEECSYDMNLQWGDASVSVLPPQCSACV